MGVSEIVARAVAMVGAAAILARRGARHLGPQAVGPAPAIPAARPQAVPTLKMPTARGWPAGTAPTPAPGLRVNAFATGLKHPRWIEVLPNGDVLTAEALQEPGRPRSAFDYAMQATMKRAAALGTSPNRITLLRDADGDGTAELRETYLSGLNQPFGMALVGETFYVGVTDGLLAFDYRPGATRLDAAPRRLADFKPGGHWTRSLLASPDGARIYVGVGSLSNIGDHGMAAEEGRAARHPDGVPLGGRAVVLGPARRGRPRPGRAVAADRRRRGRRDLAGERGLRRRPSQDVPVPRQPCRSSSGRAIPRRTLGAGTDADDLRDPADSGSLGLETPR